MNVYRSSAPGGDQGLQLQLPLPLAEFHRRPLCSMGRDSAGLWSGTYRHDPVTAWRDFRHVQHDTGSSRTGLFLDVDRLASAVHDAVDRALLPFPTVLLTRATNGHEAAAWVLDVPVHTHATARRKPMECLARVGEYFAAVSGADPGYTGLLFGERRRSGSMTAVRLFIVDSNRATSGCRAAISRAPGVGRSTRTARRPARAKLQTAVGYSIPARVIHVRGCKAVRTLGREKTVRHISKGDGKDL